MRSFRTIAVDHVVVENWNLAKNGFDNSTTGSRIGERAFGVARMLTCARSYRKRGKKFEGIVAAVDKMRNDNREATAQLLKRRLEEAEKEANSDGCTRPTRRIKLVSISVVAVR